MPTFDARVTDNDHNVSSYDRHSASLGMLGKPNLTEPIIMGWSSGAKTASRDRAVVGRFNLDIPQGAGIRSVKMGVTAWSSQNWTGTNVFQWQTGFLKMDGIWNVDTGSAFDDYPTHNSFPHPLINTVNEDLTVLWDDTGFFVQQATAPVFTQDVEYEWGDNNSPTYSLAGMAANLEDYLGDAGNNANRVSGKLPIAFYLIRSAGNAGTWELGSYTFATTPAKALHLIVEWDPPGEAELTSSATMDARGTLDALMHSELAAQTTLDAGATVAHPGETELSAQATLDAGPIVARAGETELSAQATIDFAATSIQNPTIGINGREVTRLATAASISRAAADVEITRRAASASATRREASATLNRVEASATLTRRPSSVSVTRNPRGT